MRNLIKLKGAGIFFTIIFILIVIANFKPGFFILGNDNFSPELDPGLTLKRSIFSPAWRTHRALGVPSDSEQADVFRTLLYFVLSKFAIPGWLISQLYLYTAFFIAMYSFGLLAHRVLKKYFNTDEWLKILGGLFYASSLLTVWIYFSPVHLFVAAYSFLPLVLWRLVEYRDTPSRRNLLLLLIASALLSTSALTATLFLVAAIVIFLFDLLFTVQQPKYISRILKGVFFILALQLFWLIPFVTYVRSNTPALRDSLIYRKVTNNFIENEARYNTALNTFRYNFSWLDNKENGRDYSYKYRSWFKENPVGILLGYIPISLALIGSIFFIKKKAKDGLLIIFIAFVGWFFIKGPNPPFGGLFTYIQNNFPIYFGQVFRWQSSKFWPLLAITQPLLATTGLLWLAKLLNPQIRKIFLIVAVLVLLLFINSFFRGYLVRDEAYVKVPNAYFKLADYLKKNDSTSRIYISPEANTLYFRDYKWGFWGSVFLNYILPNPIIEKALIVGSYENENAFQVLHSAYYSEDPRTFANALKIFDIPYVVSDKNVSNNFLGYYYDWELHQKMVDNNAYFLKIWQQDGLSLYKVKEVLKEPKATQIYTHQQTSLNLILAKTKPIQYFTRPERGGLIYPFALDFDNFLYDSSNQQLIGSHRYQADRQQYQFRVEKEQLTSSPTQILFDQEGNALLQPAFPSLSIDSQMIDFAKPKSFVATPPASKFLSLDFDVVPKLVGTAANLSIAYSRATVSSTLKAWGSQQSNLNLLDRKSPFALWCNGKPETSSLTVGRSQVRCGTSWISQEKDAIVEGSFTTQQEGEKETQFSLCINSRRFYRCLNPYKKNRVKGPNTYNFLIPRVVDAGDSIQVFLDFATNDGTAKVAVTDFTLSFYQDKKDVKLSTFEEVADRQEASFELSPGSLINFYIPILQGEDTYLVSEGKTFYPDSSISREGNNSVGGIEFDQDKGIIFSHKKNTTSLFANLPLISGEGLGMVFVEGKHESGIPADVRIRTTKKLYYLWENKLFPKNKSQLFDLFALTPSNPSYNIEVFSTAFGPNYSQNILNNFIFQVIPEGWYSLVLQPKNEVSLGLVNLQQPFSIDTSTFAGSIKKEGATLVALPTAVSPYWRLTRDNLWGEAIAAQPVTVNGWRQGWIMNQRSDLYVIYWPNLLVYLGYVVVLILFAMPLILLMKNAVRRRFVKPS